MSQSQTKQNWVDTLKEEMPLTPLDYTAPQNYIRRSLAFPFPNSASKEEAVNYLRHQLSQVLVSVPFLWRTDNPR